MAAGRDAGARLLGLADRPTAVFCAKQYLLALGVSRPCTRPGYRGCRGHRDRRLRRHRVRRRAAVPRALTSVRQRLRHHGRSRRRPPPGEIDAADHGSRHEHRRVVLQPESSSSGSASLGPR
ncbi:hypothetical protein [Streptomyces sp. KL116D]|uniref:hypothetical protein n=1 Tax=Streptomyces sp. KL116D TaxID=3045152 RepID=UPI0035560985